MPLDDTLLAAVGRSADPDRALGALGRLLDAVDDRTELVAALSGDERLLGRLSAVLGLSMALSDHLVRHPEHWHDLADLDPIIDPTPVSRARCFASSAPTRTATCRWPPGRQLETLRVAYRRRLLQIAALDLADGLDVAAVSAELADLAAATLDAGLAIAGPACRRTPRRAGWRSSGWANAVAASSTMSPTST